MSFMEDLVKLKSKLAEAVRLGVIDDKNFADMYQASLIQVLNSCESQRQECTVQIDNLKKQLTNMEGQERAYSRVSYLLFQILDGYIGAAQRAAREEADRAEEFAEKRRMVEEVKKLSEAVTPQDELHSEEKKGRKKAPKTQEQ